MLIFPCLGRFVMLLALTARGQKLGLARGQDGGLSFSAPDLPLVTGYAEERHLQFRSGIRDGHPVRVAIIHQRSRGLLVFGNVCDSYVVSGLCDPALQLFGQKIN